MYMHLVHVCYKHVVQYMYVGYIRKRSQYSYDLLFHSLDCGAMYVPACSFDVVYAGKAFTHNTTCTYTCCLYVHVVLDTGRSVIVSALLK